MSYREDSERAITWWAHSPTVRNRVVPVILVVIAATFLAGVVWWLRGDLNPRILLFDIPVAWLLWRSSRARTQVTGDGIEVVALHRRRYAWENISAVTGTPQGSWSHDVKAQLTSGRTVRFPFIEKLHLDDVLRFRPDPAMEGSDE